MSTLYIHISNCEFYWKYFICVKTRHGANPEENKSRENLFIYVYARFSFIYTSQNSALPFSFRITQCDKEGRAKREFWAFSELTRDTKYKKTYAFPASLCKERDYVHYEIDTSSIYVKSCFFCVMEFVSVCPSSTVILCSPCSRFWKKNVNIAIHNSRLTNVFIPTILPMLLKRPWAFYVLTPEATRTYVCFEFTHTQSCALVCSMYGLFRYTSHVKLMLI